MNEMADEQSAAPRRILAVSGPAENDGAGALAFATELAGAFGASLGVLTVLGKPYDWRSVARFTGLNPEDAQRSLREQAQAQIEARVAPYRAYGPIDVEVRDGKAFLEVIRTVMAGGFDLVIKDAEAIADGERHLLTSTDQHLLRKCPCPVWLLRGEALPADRPVVAAVDVDLIESDDPEGQVALNQAIARQAAVIAGLRGVPLHLLHVWDAPAESLVRGWAPAGDAPIRYVRGVEAERRQALQTLTDWLAATEPVGPGGNDIYPRLMRGAPRDIVPAQISELRAGTLVMGTVGRTGIPGVIIGNTAEDVLNRVSCSLLTVKPPGYVSPLAAK